MVPISRNLGRIIWNYTQDETYRFRRPMGIANSKHSHRQLRGPHSAALSLIFSTRSTNLPTRCRSATSSCSLRRMTSRMASRSAGSKVAVGFPVLQPVRSLQLFKWQNSILNTEYMKWNVSKINQANAWQQASVFCLARHRHVCSRKSLMWTLLHEFTCKTSVHVN